MNLRSRIERLEAATERRVALAQDPYEMAISRMTTAELAAVDRMVGEIERMAMELGCSVDDLADVEELREPVVHLLDDIQKIIDTTAARADVRPE
ncbi:MAG: hypothetical protein HY941_07165 [Gammaproteobacteria bacterium]|nr:hypothetical protein [Gammaproteobacteria bacterium]